MCCTFTNDSFVNHLIQREKREIEMGKAEAQRLNRALSSHMSNIHDTLQVLDQTPSSSLKKVAWDEVIKMGEQLSKHTTTAGMLFTDVKTEVKALEENMVAYYNALQGLLLLAYGSTVGAGPTLSSSIHASIKQVVDCSFVLWKDCVSSYESHNKEQKRTIPQSVGIVWDACSALKKTPSTNITAIGREMTRVAVSVKDVLREMKELEPCSSDPTNQVADTPSCKSESEPHDDSDVSIADDDVDDLGKDLSPEEMKVAQLAIGVVYEALVIIKELIRSITGLLKKENLGEKWDGVDSLEKLLGLCRGVGVVVDELGAGLYPPQEFSAITKACKDMSSLTDEMHQELESLNGDMGAFSQGCKALKNAVEMLISEVSESIDGDDVLQNSSPDDIVPEMQNLTVKN